MNKYLSIILVLTVGFQLQCGKSDKTVAEKKENKQNNESRFTTAKGGLRMRDKPNTTGSKIGTIPEGTKVDLLEETGEAMTIAGTTGKWSKVKWNDKTGWVFGGFLTEKSSEALIDKVMGKTIVYMENSQDGPYFFMQINSDKSYTAVCQVSRIVRGQAKGDLREKYIGKWLAEEKGGRLSLNLTGKYNNFIFGNDIKKKEGVMKTSILNVEEKNGKIFFAMKNTQSHDSCFSAETLEQNYGWKIEDVGYFQKIMGNTYFPK